MIFGNQGQDDLIGGSSSFYSLVDCRRSGRTAATSSSAARARAADRSFTGDVSASGHANDADAIVGDNGNIVRLVRRRPGELGGLRRLAYDSYGGLTAIQVVRARSCSSTTRRAAPTSTRQRAALDIGGADVIHGESGDDTIYGRRATTSSTATVRTT